MGKIIQIREVGDPALNTKCEEVDINKIDNEILDIIDDMKQTLAFSTGIGIAAPQIGVSKRIIMIEIKKEKCSSQDLEEVANTVMINPTWKKISDETKVEYEGCLSVPQIRGKVERYTDIEVTYYNEKGEKITKKVHGLEARDIQHECDHLDGIVFLEKVTSKNGFATVKSIKKYDLRNK